MKPYLSLRAIIVRAAILMMLGLTACSLKPPIQAHLPFLPAGNTPTPKVTPTVSGRYRELLPPTAYTITNTQSIANSKASTPTPAKTSSLPTIVPTSTIDAIPHFSSDLLFLSESRLGRWNDVSDELSLMAANVVSFTSSENGHNVALLRSRGLGNKNENMFNLDVMDLQTNQTRTILKDIQQIFLLAISPDGQWMAYTSQERGGSIFLLSVENGAAPIKLGNCSQPDHTLNCDNRPVWSPDSRSLAWSDEQGVWVYTMESDKAVLAVPGKLAVSDPKGELSDVQVSFNQMSWSPQGRYLEAGVSPSGSNVHWQAVLDTRTGRVGEVPETYTQARTSSVLTWLPDGRLCQIRSSDRQQSQGPVASIYRVLPTRDDLLLELNSFSLQSDAFPSIENNLAELNDVPAWLEAIDERLVSFAMFLPEQAQPGALFTMDLKYGTVQKINELPNDTQMILWAPDHAGTLIRSQQGEILFIPRDGSAPQNLTPSLGSDAKEFRWLPMISIH
jgi:Tol biopolymer transport system component